MKFLSIIVLSMTLATAVYASQLQKTNKNLADCDVCKGSSVSDQQEDHAFNQIFQAEKEVPLSNPVNSANNLGCPPTGCTTGDVAHPEQ